MILPSSEGPFNFRYKNKYSLAGKMWLRNDLHAHSKLKLFVFPAKMQQTANWDKGTAVTKNKTFAKGNGNTKGIIQPCQR
jgi:hypothetical protein